MAETDFSPNPARLRMFSYGPKGVDAPALVVVLHGCTQTAEGYADGVGWMALAERYGFALLCPEQTIANNPNRCFNWFEPGQTARGAGEAASIAAMIEESCVRYGVDRTCIYITGLSAGGAMAAVMLSAYPELFAAGAVVAGLPFGSASNVQEAFAAMMQPKPRSAAAWGKLVRRASEHAGDPWPAVSIWHGEADSTVHPDNAQGLARQWRHVHGLTDTAPQVELRGGVRRQVWSGPGGDARVTLYTAPGLGHGAPVVSGGPDACGAAGPFLIEAGLSAALQTARDWGLAPEAAEASAAPVTSPPQHHSLAHEIESVIRKTLSAAGLL